MTSSESAIFIGEQAQDLLWSQFGMSTQELLDVAKRLYAGFTGVTSLHPKGFSGTNAWAQGTSALRETLIPKGWRPDDPSGQPRVTSDTRKVAITVSSGDAYTGDPTHDPQTRNDKGTQTFNSVHFNSKQGRLFEIVSSADRRVALSTDGQALWILLYYIDLEGGEVRLELSKPSEMSEANKVSGWAARMIFAPLDVHDIEDGDDSIDDIPDIDIDVIPKL